MGVTGLWKLIDQSGKPVPVDTLENKILAVDISIWLHQVVKGFQDSNGATLPNAHLLGLFHRLCKLLYYRIRPVFVFDGGVPPLKRETIAKRAHNKNKYQSEADKLQKLLLEALAKEKVVQQALGPSTSALVSPKKAVQKNSNENEENDMFKLPPMEEMPKDESFTDISESDGSFEEKHRTHYSHNLHAIDVKSSYFQSLPADIRHEILSDIKETRKQSSWGRLHELPAESQSFSSFQMKRLLKRRQVQVELEEAEKEMGGKGISMADLENLLSEEGVVDPDIATERIASSEHVRFLHVRDLTKAMKKEAEEKIKQENLEVIKEEQENMEIDVNQEDELKSIINCEHVTKEEIDLQRAIQLSLGGGEESMQHGFDDEESDAVRLTFQQKKALASAANSLARHYMVEYGGMNDEEVSDLVKLNESMHDKPKEFKYNDDSILIGKIASTSSTTAAQAFHGKEFSQRLNIETEKVINMSESSSDENEDNVEISSDADSDFVDVPEMSEEEDNTFFARSKLPLPPPFLMNQPPLRIPIGSEPSEATSSDAKIEVVINPGQICDVGDDIFADIFQKSDEKSLPNPITADEIKEKSDGDQSAEIEENGEKSQIEENSTIYIEDSPVKNSQPDLQLQPQIPTQPEVLKINSVSSVNGSENNSSNSKIQSILSGLDNEKQAISNMSLNDLLEIKSVSSPLAETQSVTELEFLDKFKNDEKTATADDLEKRLVTPTKIPQPFFVKKTPPSSKKKSPHSDKMEHDQEPTPSKVAKSLTEAFESLPSTSSGVLTEKESMNMAANVLREKKSKEELEDIAEQLNQERRYILAERNKKERLGVSITEQMSMECMELLRLFGVPYVVAPMEAEAQCAYLNEINLTEGTITDDSDIWLFGGRTVYKNFFDQNKHVLEFKSDNIQRLFHLDRDKLIQLSFLVGSDYTQGIHGIGAVTALEILSIFPQTTEKQGETTQIVSILSSLRKFRDWWYNRAVGQKASTLRNKLKNITINEDFPNTRVVEAYLFPTVDENREQFSWGHPDSESIREYAKKTFGWTRKRTDEIILPVLKRLGEKKSQQSIQNYFKITEITSRQELKVSKRVRTALEQMSADPDAPLAIDEVVEKKKPKKKTVKVATETETTTETAAGKQAPEKTRARRKRKVATETETKTQTEAEVESKKERTDNSTEPSISTNQEEKIVLPDNNAPIPQREKNKKIMESNKLKAIEVLKKMKASRK